MVETGTFPFGIVNETGTPCTAFTLAERAFRHVLEVAHDPAIDNSLLTDPVYYDAAILAKRLSVDGIDKLTPEMVLDLDGEDGDELATAIMDLDQRRAEFRSAQRANAQAAAGIAETGGAVAGGPGHAAGGSGQSAE